jgi:hypothetical protein
VTQPYPPADLDSRTPKLLTLPAGSIAHRFFNQGYDPIFFDPGQGGRLNAPDGTYGVLYAAATANGAFAETFLRHPGRRQIPDDLLKRKAYAGLRVRRDLKLIRLSGTGLAPLGATAEVTHGGLPYSLPQAWSKSLHSHPCVADGIAYTARHDETELCYAIFERSRRGVVEAERRTNLDEDWFWELAETYDVGLAPS